MCGDFKTSSKEITGCHVPFALCISGSDSPQSRLPQTSLTQEPSDSGFISSGVQFLVQQTSLSPLEGFCKTTWVTALSKPFSNSCLVISRPAVLTPGDRASHTSLTNGVVQCPRPGSNTSSTGRFSSGQGSTRNQNYKLEAHG